MNRRLYRSRTDTMIGGVAAGLADLPQRRPGARPDRLGHPRRRSPAGSRSSSTSSPGSWSPRSRRMSIEWRASRCRIRWSGEACRPRPHRSGRAPRPAQRRSGWTPGMWRAAWWLVVLGTWFLLVEYLPDIDWGLIWPLVLVAIGVLIVVTSMRRREADRLARPLSASARRGHAVPLAVRAVPPVAADAARRGPRPSAASTTPTSSFRRSRLRSSSRSPCRRVGELEVEVPRRQGARRVDVPVRHRQRRAEREDERRRPPATSTR